MDAGVHLKRLLCAETRFQNRLNSAWGGEAPSSAVADSPRLNQVAALPSSFAGRIR